MLHITPNMLHIIGKRKSNPSYVHDANSTKLLFNHLGKSLRIIIRRRNRDFFIEALSYSDSLPARY